jgi:hypothetical protein
MHLVFPIVQDAPVSIPPNMWSETPLCTDAIEPGHACDLVACGRVQSTAWHNPPLVFVLGFFHPTLPPVHSRVLRICNFLES